MMIQNASLFRGCLDLHWNTIWCVSLKVLIHVSCYLNCKTVMLLFIKPSVFKSSVNHSSSAFTLSAVQTRILIGGQELHVADIEESNVVSSVGSLGAILRSRHHRTVGNRVVTGEIRYNQKYNVQHLIDPKSAGLSNLWDWADQQ